MSSWRDRIHQTNDRKRERDVIPYPADEPGDGAMSVAVIGVGNTTFGKLGYTADQLGGWALTEALADAGLQNKDIDGLIVNRVSS